MAPAVSLGVVYIPGVLLISIVWGLRLGPATAIVSALPSTSSTCRRSARLDVRADHDLVALVVFAIVAIASGTLAKLARARAAEAERRRQEADRALAELAALEPSANGCRRR